MQIGSGVHEGADKPLQPSGRLFPGPQPCQLLQLLQHLFIVPVPDLEAFERQPAPVDELGKPQEEGRHPRAFPLVGLPAGTVLILDRVRVVRPVGDRLSRQTAVPAVPACPAGASQKAHFENHHLVVSRDKVAHPPAVASHFGLAAGTGQVFGLEHLCAKKG